MGVDRARARRLTESENDDDDDRSLDAREEVGDGDDESDEEDVDGDSVVRASLERASERDAEIADERDTRVRILLIRERDAEFARDPKFKSRSIAELNNEAVRYLKAGDDVKCVVAYAKVFRKVSEIIGVDLSTLSRKTHIVILLYRWVGLSDHKNYEIH